MSYSFDFIAEKYIHIFNVEDLLFRLMVEGRDDNVIEGLQSIIDVLSDKIPWEEVGGIVMSPDYGAHYYIMTTTRNKKKCLVINEHMDPSRPTFELAIPLDKCHMPSLLCTLRLALNTIKESKEQWKQDKDQKTSTGSVDIWS